MARGLVAEMAAAYANPRAAMARQLAAGLDETRALFYLMAACGVFFVASVPNALRGARGIEADDPVAAAVGAHLFGFLFVAPLLLYGASVAVHGLARAFGGRGSALAARTALFWSLLLVAPVTLAIALVGMGAEVLVGPHVLPWLSVLRYGGLALWLWLFAATLAEAEGFAHSTRVVAVVLAGLAVVAAITVLAGGAVAAR